MQILIQKSGAEPNIYISSKLSGDPNVAGPQTPFEQQTNQFFAPFNRTP